MSAAEPQPITDSDLAAALRLSLVPGVGPRTRMELLERFGSAEAVFAAPAGELRSVPSVGQKVSQAILAAPREIDVEAVMELYRRNGVRLVGEQDEEYPCMLKEIVDPPGILFVRGSIQPPDATSIAIVGSRHGTHYGRDQASRLAGSLARAGLTIVSGLARGIDAAAHRGALEAGGRTLAVLGGGVLEIYPPEHRPLAEQISDHGAVVSEAPPTASPRGSSFPQRNRLISGLSLGVIVVEAAHRSGALITARHAMEQGREVFAVPGRVDSRTSHGCHRLIRDGAKLVETVDDVLEELGPLVQPAATPDGHEVRHPAELSLTPTQRTILDAIAPDGISIDQIVATTGLLIHDVLSLISDLEMRRLIRRLSGNMVCRMN